MFNFFKKKATTISAPISGTLQDISAVNDEVFSTKMMGPGLAITPSEGVGTLVAPGNGEVLSVFPTQHAITMLLDNKVEVLLHIGLDTVELAGAPFDVQVKAGDRLKTGTPLVNVDFEGIRASGKDTDVLLIITNAAELTDFPTIEAHPVQQNDPLIELSGK